MSTTVRRFRPRFAKQTGILPLTRSSLQIVFVIVVSPFRMTVPGSKSRTSPAQIGISKPVGESDVSVLKSKQRSLTSVMKRVCLVILILFMVDKLRVTTGAADLTVCFRLHPNFQQRYWLTISVGLVGTRSIVSTSLYFVFFFIGMKTKDLHASFYWETTVKNQL